MHFKGEEKYQEYKQRRDKFNNEAKTVKRKIFSRSNREKSNIAFKISEEINIMIAPKLIEQKGMT